MSNEQAKKKFPSYFSNFIMPKWAREQELCVYRACATGKVDKDSFLNSYEENGHKISAGGKVDDPQEYSLSTYMETLIKCNNNLGFYVNGAIYPTCVV